MKYITAWETTAQYDAVKDSLLTPHVALINENNSVEYIPEEAPLPNNIIKYKASAKLTETTSTKNGGLHTNAFNTTIVSHDFENGDGIIEFADDVTSVGNGAFYGCGTMTNVKLPSSVTTIGNSAFTNCVLATEINIPNGVTNIGNLAFYGCSGLTSVNLPESLTFIGQRAFEDCTSVQSVTGIINNRTLNIPINLTNLDYSSFGTLVRLFDNIVVDSDNSVYDSRNNCNAIIKTNTLELVQASNNTVIPSEIVGIKDFSFSYTNVENLVIPEGQTYIPHITNCPNLVSVDTPSTITSEVGAQTIIDCPSLSSIIMRASIPPRSTGTYGPDTVGAQFSRYRTSSPDPVTGSIYVYKDITLYVYSENISNYKSQTVPGTSYSNYLSAYNIEAIS